MAINCSNNSALEALNEKKAALAGKVSELKSAGAAAMGDLQAKAGEMKDALLASLPEVPKIPNFKAELAELQGKVGKELSDAKAAFNARWGKAMPDVDINGLMEKVTSVTSGSFDFCKDVPNVEAPKVDANGVVEQVKVKAEEPTVAAEIPKKVEPVEPTVVEKEKAPSASLVVKKSVSTMAAEEANMRQALDAFLKPYRKARTKAGTNQFLVTQKKGWDKVKEKLDEGYTHEDYYNNNFGKDTQRALVREWFEHKIEKNNNKLIMQNCMDFHIYGTSKRIIQRAKQNIDFNYKRLDTDYVDEEGYALNRVTLGGFGKIAQEYADIMLKYDKILLDLELYRTH